MRALDRDGKQIEFDADGLLAVCIQHEIDHLDGKLFVDYLSELKRTRIRKKLEKERKDARPPGSARSGAESASERVTNPVHRLRRHAGVLRAGARSAGALAASRRRRLHAARSSRRPRPAAGNERGQAVRAAARLAGRAAATLRDAGRGRTTAAAGPPMSWSSSPTACCLPQAVLRYAATRLRQHSRVAAAALARRCADSARDRWPATPQTGVTIMQMEAGLDTGPMLLDARSADRCARNRRDLARSARSARRGSAARRARRNRAGHATPRAQPADGVTYAAKIRKEEALIDWSRSAARDRSAGSRVQSVAGRGDALEWSAVARLGGDADRFASRQQRPAPCSRTGAAGIDVATGNGVLRLTRVQSAGRKAMSAAEFLNAHRLDGAVLGIVSRSAAVRAAAAKIVADVAMRGRSLDAALTIDSRGYSPGARPAPRARVRQHSLVLAARCVARALADAARSEARSRRARARDRRPVPAAVHGDSRARGRGRNGQCGAPARTAARRRLDQCDPASLSARARAARRADRSRSRRAHRASALARRCARARTGASRPRRFSLPTISVRRSGCA